MGSIKYILYMVWLFSFKGIKEVYDGFLKCVLYNKHNKVLDMKQVEIHVIRMKFTLGSTSQTEVGVPALPIGLEEGDYEIVCKSFGSNPNASVHIYLNNEELMDPELVIEDMNKTEPARAWNAQKNISLTLKLNNDDQILKCVSVDNNDPSMVAELSFKLDIFDVNCEEVDLRVNKADDTVAVGDRPSYQCFVNKDALFLLNNPIRWEKHGRDGSKTVISSLGKIEAGLERDFNVQLITSQNGMSFTLTFKHGIKEDYDGYFKCVVYNKHNVVLDEKTVEIHVIRMITGMKFTLGTTSQTGVQGAVLPIRLKEGDYETVCKSYGSNPAASVKIFLNKKEQLGTKLVIKDMNRTDPPQTWNVQNRKRVSLSMNNDGQILKCVSVVNNDSLMKAELSFKLDIFAGFDLKKQALTYGLIGCFIVILMSVLVAIILKFKVSCVLFRATLNPQNSENSNPTDNLNNRYDEMANIIQPIASQSESTGRNHVNVNKEEINEQEDPLVTYMSVSTESRKTSANNRTTQHSETSSTRSAEANGDCDDVPSLDDTDKASVHSYGIIYLQ